MANGFIKHQPKPSLQGYKKESLLNFQGMVFDLGYANNE